MALWAQDAFVTSLSKLGASDVRQSQLREMGPAAQVFANRHDRSALHREKKEQTMVWTILSDKYWCKMMLNDVNDAKLNDAKWC